MFECEWVAAAFKAISPPWGRITAIYHFLLTICFHTFYASVFFLFGNASKKQYKLLSLPQQTWCLSKFYIAKVRILRLFATFFKRFFPKNCRNIGNFSEIFVKFSAILLQNRIKLMHLNKLDQIYTIRSTFGNKKWKLKKFEKFWNFQTLYPQNFTFYSIFKKEIFKIFACGAKNSTFSAPSAPKMWSFWRRRRKYWNFFFKIE